MHIMNWTMVRCIRGLGRDVTPYVWNWIISLFSFCQKLRSVFVVDLRHCLFLLPMSVEFSILNLFLGKPKKNLFLMAVPLRGGGGVRLMGLPLRKRSLFLLSFIQKKIRLPIRLKGEGLNDTAIKKIFFFAASLTAQNSKTEYFLVLRPTHFRDLKELFFNIL